MSIIRKVARPLLAASFIANGVQHLRDTDEAAELFQPSLEEVASILPQAETLSKNPKRAVQVIGGVEVGAGLLLAAGKFPRAASLLLVTVHEFSTYAEYRAADVDSADDVSAQRAGLLKNVSILGGLWLAAVDRDGKPSLSWRADHLAKVSKKKGNQFRDRTIKWAEGLGEDATKTAKALERDASKNFRRAERDARRVIVKTAKDAKKKAEDLT